MTLRRLNPLVKRENLGPLRLWQDELSSMVSILQQLKDVKLDVQADGYQLDDVEVDLPNIPKSRLDRFTATAMRITHTDVASASPTGSSSSTELVSESEILSLRLAKDYCCIEATEPDPETRGVMSDIVALAAQHHRSRVG
jgi:hypothetical protein